MGLVLSEEFLGVFVMEKRRSLWKHTVKVKTVTQKTTKSTIMTMMAMMMLMTEGFPKKKMATREPPITYSGLRGQKSKGAKNALPAETQVRGASLVDLRTPGFGW